MQCGSERWYAGAMAWLSTRSLCCSMRREALTCAANRVAQRREFDSLWTKVKVPRRKPLSFDAKHGRIAVRKASPQRTRPSVVSRSTLALIGDGVACTCQQPTTMMVVRLSVQHHHGHQQQHGKTPRSTSLLHQNRKYVHVHLLHCWRIVTHRCMQRVSTGFRNEVRRRRQRQIQKSNNVRRLQTH